MECEVDTVIEDPRWEHLLPPLAQAAADATLADRGLDPSGFLIVVMGCDDARIAALNSRFRDRPAPTNVLAWPAREAPAASPPPPPPAAGTPDDPAELGDIAIAFDTCAREAEAQGKPFDHHVTHLLVHAVLHLLGYDHQTEVDATLMEGIEIGVLAKRGMPNPY